MATNYDLPAPSDADQSAFSQARSLIDNWQSFSLLAQQAWV